MTDALHRLEGDGIVKAQRGIISIRNREGLEAVAGGSYGVPEAEYRRLLGSLTKSNGRHHSSPEFPAEREFAAQPFDD